MVHRTEARRPAPWLLAGALVTAQCTEPREGCDLGQVLVGNACRDELPSAPDGGPACPAGLTLCDGFCRDARTDEGHCGRCGQRCTSTQVCIAGTCSEVTGCTGTRQMCGGVCVDTSSDSANCGQCSASCPPRMSCSSGRCECPAGETACAEACVDLANDRLNCGACGAAQGCAAGRCVGNPAGFPCGSPADCPGGLCLHAGQGFPGGYCVYACDPGAAANSSCRSGTGLCVDLGAGSLLCVGRCRPGQTAACRPNYVCLVDAPGSAVGVCWPHCATNAALLCGAFRCDAASGACDASGCRGAGTCAPLSTCNAATQRCECTAGTDCGPDRRCFAGAPGGVPFCGCTSSRACPLGRACDATGVCR